MQGPLPKTRRETLVPSSFRSTRKGFLSFSASQNLKRWGSASPTTVGMDTKLSAPRMGGFNSTRIK